MEITILAIAVTALLSALVSNWNIYRLQEEQHRLDMDIEDLMNMAMSEMVRSQQFRDDVSEKVDDYGDFTERLLDNLKNK